VLKKISGSLKEFDSYYSIAEKFYQILIFLIIFGGGSGITSLMAYFDPYFSSYGAFGYTVIFLFSSLTIFASLYFFKGSKANSAKKKYFESLSQKGADINPLLENFSDQVIYLEDLRLPLSDPQLKKTFRRCHLVGPLTIGILGGSYNGCGFRNSGHTLALPEFIDGPIFLNGVLLFQECTFIECTFIEVTVITTHQIGQLFKDQVPGSMVIGLSS